MNGAFGWLLTFNFTPRTGLYFVCIETGATTSELIKNGDIAGSLSGVDDPVRMGNHCM